MNFPLLSAILQSDLPCGQRMILTVLLNHAGGGAHSWPSQVTVAAQSGLCERAVRDHIKELLRSGWLAKNGRNYIVTEPAKSAGIERGGKLEESADNRQNLPVCGNEQNRQNLPKKPADSSKTPAKSAAKPLKNHSRTKIQEPIFPDDLPEEYRVPLRLWWQHKREQRKTYTATGWALLLREQRRKPLAELIRDIEFSASKNYQGIFPPPTEPQNNRNYATHSTKPIHRSGATGLANSPDRYAAPVPRWSPPEPPPIGAGATDS